MGGYRPDRRFTVRAIATVVVLGVTAALVAILAGAVPWPGSATPASTPRSGATIDSESGGTGSGSAAQIPANANKAAINDARTGRRVVAPCAPSAEACVQLSTAHIWLTRDGEVLRDGFISSGGADEETPTGIFTVQWKDRDHISGESGAPMPYSVFFTTRGHALHQGSLGTESAGCVRLTPTDAAAFFNALRPGDELQILP